MNIDGLIQSLESRFPVQLSVYDARINDDEYAGAFTISRIEISKENQKTGIGSKVMRELVNFADGNNLLISLTPEKISNTSRTTLIKFYKSFGFVPNKGNNKHWDFTDAMIRYPKGMNEMEDKIKGGNADGKSAKDLAMKHHQFIGTIEHEIGIGTKIEMEHTKNEGKAREIAMDHIDEFWDYYSNPEHGLKASEKKMAKNESFTGLFNKLLNEAVSKYRK